MRSDTCQMQIGASELSRRPRGSGRGVGQNQIGSSGGSRRGLKKTGQVRVCHRPLNNKHNRTAAETTGLKFEADEHNRR
ncbi:hypothetical protein PIB30_005031 [Stylosanthes scabra]|uniref:Uncharacterized protein n=1 Tax=Stylosanthes scabra TaxID=79078 RepID=A0ABU6Y3A7_9FABA|nr:hypothetical protein [Stylosanthes scabra]